MVVRGIRQSSASTSEIWPTSQYAAFGEVTPAARKLFHCGKYHGTIGRESG
jgi:hypothetical protein